MKVLREGQCLRHDLYGIGIATGSNEERTTIDFYEHGRRTFVTHMLQAELVPEAPPRPPRPRGTDARAAKDAKRKTKSGGTK
jgi:hypothetical protein